MTKILHTARSSVMSMSGICERIAMLCFEYYFKNECEGFIRFPNERKHLKPRGRRPSGFYCFRAFESLMKPEARVFEITSPTKKISSNYHFDEFSQFKSCCSRRGMCSYHLRAHL